jgi:hypothetical protein
VLAAIRGVPAVRAGRGTGYGELFEALVLLHQGHPAAALDVLGDRPAGLYGQVFRQWSAALLAEAAVLAGAAAAPELLATATAVTSGNPVAAAIAARAVALAGPDRAALARVAADLDRAGAPYQTARTRTLAAALPD